MTDKGDGKTIAEKAPICFVISPIGAEQSETRKRSNQVLKHIIQPAAKQCGYDVVRADHINATGIITSQVVQYIMESPLVIADLTDSNANVFYELAIRHMLRKPYIQMIHKLQPPPFDVSSVRTLFFNHLDLDEAELARDELTKQIRAVEAQKEVESPISVAVDLEKLSKSDKPEQRQMADLLKGFAALQNEVEKISRMLPVTYVPAASGAYLLGTTGEFSEQTWANVVDTHFVNPLGTKNLVIQTGLPTMAKTAETKKEKEKEKPK